MNLRLLKLTYENIREFSKLELPLTATAEATSPHHVTLVQMPNGTGKTTTMNLLRHALSGTLPEEREVMSFRPLNFSAPKGRFEVTLALDERVITVRLELDYAAGTAKFFTARQEVRGGGLNEGHTLPPEVRYVLTHDFTRLFVFDGELPKKLLKTEQHEAEHAIKALHFLDRLERLKDKVDDAVNAKRQAAGQTKAASQQGLRNLLTRLENARKGLKELQQKVEASTTELSKKQESLSKGRHRLDELLKQDAGATAKSHDLDKQIEQTKAEIEKNTLSMLRAFRRPSSFSPLVRARIQELGSRMVLLKLPRTTSLEFFKELASQANECICGDPLTPEKRKRILENAERYLSEDNIQNLNAIKHDIRNMAAFDSHAPLVEQVPTLAAKLQEHKQDQQTIQLRVKDEKAREEIISLQKRIKKEEDEVTGLEWGLRLLTEADTSFVKDHNLNEENNIPQCQKQIANLSAKVDEAASTVSFTKKSELLKDILDQVVAKSIAGLKGSIVKGANRRIEGLLGNGDIRIEGISDCIRIHERESVSEGQHLAVAYSFLSTLFEDSPHEVPFIVDSPAGSLDLKVRFEVGSLVPKLFAQLVIFIISSERTEFVRGIEQSKDVQYYTVQKDNARPGKVVVKTSKEDFHRFQSEEN
jgi:DNA sulfur modification protein DndD